VHNGALMNQWVGAIGEWLGMAPGTIGGGRKPDVSKPVVVAMQQSLARMAKTGAPPAWTDTFGVLAGDEVHHWAATTFQAVGRMFRAKHFIGVSADERRKDGLEFLIEWTFGSVVHEIKRDDLESVGRLVPIRMHVVPTDYQDELYLETVGNDESPDWVGMVSRMMDVRRTAALERAKVVWRVVERIVKDVPGARVLVLNDRVEACKMMVEQFGMMGLRAGLLIGGTENKKELERTKAGLQGGRLDVGVGTTIADEGLDIPALTHVVVTSPVAQHPRRLEQMVGRAARPWPGKERAVAVYVWDRLMFPPVPVGDIKRERLERRFMEKLGAVVPDVRLMERVDFAGD
jgi:superfamily II DNA or RNA helicase